jgi:hypothetical protein
VTVTLIAETGTEQSTPISAKPDAPIAIRADSVAMPIRLRRPPSSEPPYDAAFPTPPTAVVRRANLVATPSCRTPQPVGIKPGAMPDTAASAAPPIAASAQRYVRTCLEVLNGFRPASHLRTLAGPVEFSTVVSQLSRRRNGRGHFPQASDTALTQVVSAPVNRRAMRPDIGAANNSRTQHLAMTNAAHGLHGGTSTAAQRNAPGAAQPFRLLRMRLSEPLDGVAEIVAVLSYAGSSLAMALRLERHDDQWLCALVQVI